MSLDHEETIRILFLEPKKNAFESINSLMQEWFQDYIHITWRSLYQNGIQELKTGKYDLIISELSFPEEDKNEEELLQDLLEIAGPYEVPLVIIAGKANQSFQIEALQMGISEFFSKRRIKKSLLESRFRNLFREIYRKKIIGKQIDESLRKFQEMYGMSQSEIQDLNGLIRQFKLDLEKEYEEKAKLDLEKKKMQNVFGMYVDPMVVEGILNNSLSLDQRGKVMEISVLFSDIRGYTTLSENQNPQQVISFLNEYFTAMTEVILGYGGMIDKYIGDSIMCLFGAPMERPTHREEAVECAMEMIQVFELWQPKWESIYGFIPRIGIGIASGQCVVGNVGSFQKLSYTAVGDTVNMASRLESIAKPMQVLIADAVYNKLPSEILKKYNFREMEPVSIKGKAGTHTIIAVSHKEAQN